MRRTGFTLLELLVVLVLVALVAASVIIAWSGVYQKAAFESAIAQLESLDQHMRSYARQRGRTCVLEFDRPNDRLRKVYNLEDPEQQPWQRLGATLRKIEVAGSRTRQSRVEISYDKSGISPTFVLELSGPRRQEWLLFAGVGGQLTRLETESQRDAILSLLSL